MPTIGSFELILILVIVAMLFGVGKLPEVFGAVGKGIREFRQNAGDPGERNGAGAAVRTAPAAGEDAPEPKTDDPSSQSNPG
jgi:sec-independent protein translocase protein TatA